MLEGDSSNRGEDVIMLSGESYNSSARYQPGTVVEVMPRLWPGMNKQGGTARITRVSYDQEEDCFLYDVAYIVNHGRETGVEDCFIKPIAYDPRRRKMHGRCKFCGSFIRDCNHDQDGPDPFKMPKDQQMSHEEPGDRHELLAILAKLEEENSSELQTEQSTRTFTQQSNAISRSKQTSNTRNVVSRKRAADGTVKKEKRISRHRNFQYDDVMSSVPETEPMQPTASEERATVTQQQFQLLPQTSQQQLPSRQAPTTHYEGDADIPMEIENTDTAWDDAKALHKRIFDNCLQLENQEDADDAFIVRKSTDDNTFMKYDFQQLIKQISKLSQAAAFELLRISFNFSMNLIKKLDIITKKREAIKAICQHKEQQQHSLREEVDDFAEDLAQRIVDIDDEQENFFRQIERAGFDVFKKAEQRVRATMKGNPNKLMRRQIELWLLQIEETSMACSSQIKSSRSEVESMANWFYEFYSKSVENVVDGLQESSESSASDSIIDENDDDCSTEEEILIKQNDSKPARIRDAAESAATIRRKKHHEQPPPQKIEIRKDPAIKEMTGLSFAAICTSNFKLLETGFIADSDDVIKVQPSLAQKNRSKHKRNKAESQSDDDFIASEDDCEVIYTSYRKRSNKKAHFATETSITTTNRVNNNVQIPISPTAISRKQHNITDLTATSSHNGHDRQSNRIHFSMNSDRRLTQIEVDYTRPSQSFGKGKFYHYVSPVIIDPNARFDGRVVVVEGDKLMHNMYNSVILPSASKKVIDRKSDASAYQEDRLNIFLEQGLDYFDDPSDEEREQVGERRKQESPCDQQTEHEIGVIDAIVNTNLTVLQSMWNSIEQLWKQPVDGHFKIDEWTIHQPLVSVSEDTDPVLNILEAYWQQAVDELRQESNNTIAIEAERVIKQLVIAMIKDIRAQFQETTNFLDEINQAKGKLSSHSHALEDCEKEYERQRIQNLKLMEFACCQQLKIWIKVKLRYGDKVHNINPQVPVDDGKDMEGVDFLTYRKFVELVLQVFSQIEKSFFEVDGLHTISGAVEFIIFDSQKNSFMDQTKLFYLGILTIKVQWITQQISLICHQQAQHAVNHHEFIMLVEHLLEPVVSIFGVFVASMTLDKVFAIAVMSGYLELMDLSNETLKKLLGVGVESYCEWIKLKSPTMACLLMIRSMILIEYLSHKIISHFSFPFIQSVTQESAQPSSVNEQMKRSKSASFRNLSFLVNKKCWDRLSLYFTNLLTMRKLPSDDLLAAFINHASNSIGCGLGHSSSILQKTLGQQVDPTAIHKSVGLKRIDSETYDFNLESLWACLVLMTKISSIQNTTSRVPNNWMAVKVFMRSMAEKASNCSIVVVSNGGIEFKYSNQDWLRSKDASDWVRSFDQHCSRIASMALVWDCTYDGFEVLISAFHALLPFISSLDYQIKSNIDIGSSDISNDSADDDNKEYGFGRRQEQYYPKMDIKSFVVSIFNSFQLMRSFLYAEDVDSISPWILACSTLLHQHLFAIVAMVFHSLGIMLPFDGDRSVSSIDKTRLFKGKDSCDIRFLSNLHHHLHSFLSNAIMENSANSTCSTSQNQSTQKSFSFNQYRRLKTQIGNVACRKKVLDLFHQSPSLSTGVLLCHIVKEFSTLFTTKIVQEEWKLCKELMDLFIDKVLLPPLESSSTQNQAESVNARTPIVFDSDKERSCLMLLLTLWTFNPFPIKVQLATPASSASALNQSATFDLHALIITNQEFMAWTKHLWKDEEEQLLSVQPFLQVVQLIQNIHENTLNELRVMTPMVESLLYSAIASLTALLSHWIILTKESSHRTAENEAELLLSKLKLHLFPKELVKALLTLVRLQNHFLQKSPTPSFNSTTGMAGSKSSSNVGKLNLEIASILSYTLNIVSEFLHQYMTEVIVPAIFFMQRNDTTQVPSQSISQVEVAEKQELYQFLQTFLHQNMEIFDEICHETTNFASSLRIVMSITLNRCAVVEEDFTFIMDSLIDGKQTKIDFTASGLHQQNNARDRLKFITCQNLCHVTLQALTNLHQTIMWRGSLALSAISTSFGLSHLRSNQTYFSNPQEFFHSIHQILQKSIDRDNSTGMYALEHWLWMQYFDCWKRLPCGGRQGQEIHQPRSIYPTLTSSLEVFINNYLGRIFQVEFAIRMIFKSKYKLFALCCNGNEMMEETGPLIISNALKLDANLLLSYHQQFMSKARDGIPLSTMTLNHILVQSWCDENHLDFDLLSVRLQLASLYGNGLKWLSTPHPQTHLQHYPHAQQSSHQHQYLFQQYVEKLHKQILQVIYFLRLCSFQSNVKVDRDSINNQINDLLHIFLHFSTFTPPPTLSSMSTTSLVSIEIINIYFRDYLSIQIRDLCNCLHDIFRNGSMEYIDTLRRIRIQTPYLRNLILYIRLACLTPFITRCVDWDVILHPILVVALHGAYMTSVLSDETTKGSVIVAALAKKKKGFSREFVEEVMKLLEEFMVQFLLALNFPSFTNESDQWESILNNVLTSSGDQKRITPSIYFMESDSQKTNMWNRCMVRNAITSNQALHQWQKMQGEELMHITNTNEWSTPNLSAFSQHVLSSVSPTELCAPVKKAIAALQSHKLVPVSSDAAQGIAFDLMKRIHELQVLLDDTILMYSTSWD